MALPLAVAFAQQAAPAAAKAPDRNTLSSYRVWVKPGHTDEFKAALSAHAKKFHTGDWTWRVAEVYTGPDSGAFHITEGPTSWTALDDRGDLGAEHNADYQKNITPHVERTGPESYVVFVQALSTAQIGNYSNKVYLRHMEAKPGCGPQVYDVLKSWKAIFEKQGMNVAVWRSVGSGAPGYTIAFRMKNGWKDFDEDGPSFRDTAAELWGPTGYDRMMADTAASVASIRDEMLVFDPALGSK